jgi:hypothetical protein
MENNESYDKMMDFFRAFCNAERLQIGGLLAKEAMTPTQVAERLGIRPKEAMDHLSLLAHFGYLKTHDNLYSLDSEALNALSRQVLQGSRPRSKADDFEGEEFDRKVLKDFVTPDGKLTAIPTQNKKRLVVLSYFVKLFEPGVHYPEKQVNELLRPHFADTASLRRYMVDEGLLKRENAVYWRSEE